MTNDNTIVPFKPKLVTPEVIEPDVDPDIVKMMEFYLEQARAGKLKFAGIATVDADGIGASTWAPLEQGPARTTQSLGAVSYLHARFNESALAGDVYQDDQWNDPS